MNISANSTNMSSMHSDIEPIVGAYKEVRRQSEIMCQPLEIEDYGIQCMPASPPKWHLAHTTWFFETFLLKPFQAHFKPHHATYQHLFNSYYHGIGKLFPREHRGLLSRPTVAEIYAYRSAIDEHVITLLLSDNVMSGNASARRELIDIVLLGIAHEQQHQELLLTDIKFNFYQNPLLPCYTDCASQTPSLHKQPVFGANTKLHWLHFDSGYSEIGSTDPVFCFDNELPRHRVFLNHFELANRPISNSEYLQFIRDGGYQRPELWLSDGWLERERNNWSAPLYWQQHDGKWNVFTLHGIQPLNGAAPVCHVSYYEADAYARWADARLPYETEWEHAATTHTHEVCGHFANDGVLQPRPAFKSDDSLQQLFGDVWEWTASAYAPYPGFRANPSSIGEYNGKFMCNQMVLRGGSCATVREHMRASYRNFFYPADRWQFSGIRLAHTPN